jgi:hypothetical protein
MNDGRTDKRLSLVGPGEFKRKMVWGEKWKRIRVGLLVRINGGATINGDFAFGLCSGITNGYGSNTCANFVGATTRAGNGNQYVFGAGNDIAIFTASLVSASSKHNTTVTDGGGTASMKGYPAAAPALCVNICDIQRTRLGVTSNTYKVYVQGPAGSGVAAGGPEQFLDWGNLLQIVGLPDVSSLPSTWWWDGAASTNNLTLDETNGAFDSVDIWWEHATTPVEVSAIAVCKIF